MRTKEDEGGRRRTKEDKMRTKEDEGGRRRIEYTRTNKNGMKEMKWRRIN